MLNGLAQRLHCLSPSRHGIQGDGLVIKRGRIVRLQFQRLIEIGQRLLIPLLGARRQTEVVGRTIILGEQLLRALKPPRRLFIRFRRPKRLTQA